MSNGPLGHLTAQDCLLLERIETGSLRRGRHRLFVGEEVDFGNRVLGSPPLALLLASLDLYACSSERETGKMQFPKLALPRVVFAASLSEGVLASRRLFPRWCEVFHS